MAATSETQRPEKQEVQQRKLADKMADPSRITFGLSSKSGLQVGQRGKKYGLLHPAATGTSVFGAAALEEESAAEQVRRDAAAKHSRADVQQLHAAALAEDPTAFDYDGVFDAMQQQRAVHANAARARDNKPRYIGSIIEAAKLRTIENDRVYERKLLKEREVDKELYEDKEKFITGAYRAKLAERAAHDAKLREQAQLEAQQDVTKRRDLSDFHRNLLFGDMAPAAPTTASAPVLSRPPAGLVSGACQSEAPRAPAPHAEAAVAHAEAGAAGPASGTESRLPDARSPQKPAGAGLGLDASVQRAGEAAVLRAQKAPRDAREDEEARDRAAAAALTKVGRRNDDVAVSSARERFLQRKAAQQAQQQ